MTIKARYIVLTLMTQISLCGIKADVDGGSILDEVVVTATRTPKALKDVPVVTRLISIEDIAHVDPTNIQDLLIQELPGLEFGYAMSQEVSLNMGGFGGNAILFLVDGERLAGETMDNVDYNRLTLDNIGHVEIVKGASSALYGANAVGGVVNLITRENLSPWHVTVNSMYGSQGNYARVGGVASFNTSRWNSSTTFQYHRSSTERLVDPLDALSKIRYLYGGSSTNVKERLVYRFNERFRLIARGGYFHRLSDRLSYVDHYKDYTGGLRGVYEVKNKNLLEASYSYDQYDKSRYIGGIRTHSHDYSNVQNIVHLLYTHFFDVNALTVGGDYMRDYLTTYQFEEGESHTQTSVDLFAQFDYNPVQWMNITGSLRDDYYSASRENAVTSRVALMFKPSPLTVRMTYAGGFRSPTLKEMFMTYDMASVFMVLGNKDLKPEHSHNFNLSLERNGVVESGILAGNYTVSGTGYYNIYQSRIVAAEVPDYPGAMPALQYVNQDGVKVMGADLTGRYYTKFGLGLTLSYNYFHSTGMTVDTEFTQPRPHSATWRLDYERNLKKMWKLYAALSGRYLGNPNTVYANHGSYNIWKFTLQQTLWDKVTVNFSIDNIFNYKPQYYYWNSPITIGISFNIGVTLNIGKL